jgi:hypothetical protein
MGKDYYKILVSSSSSSSTAFYCSAMTCSPSCLCCLNVAVAICGSNQPFHFLRTQALLTLHLLSAHKPMSTLCNNLHRA